MEFTNTKNGENTGTHDDVMEFVDRNRCENLYDHTCSANCKQKGKQLSICSFRRVHAEERIIISSG